MLEIRLFGGFEIRSDGGLIPLSTRLAQSLFSYLILNSGTPHRREKLAGLFWPDSTEQRARASLRHELWRIRKALAAGGLQGVLVCNDLTIAFDASADCGLDVMQLKQLGDGAASSELIRGLSVYRGELLPGFYDDWLVVEREHLHLLFERRVLQLLGLLQVEKRWPETVDWAERWLSLSQQPEAAYQALMTAYAGLGDRAKVLSTYDRCQQGLGELGLEPSKETRQLAEFKVSSGNLPTLMTSFIGREVEIQQISSMLFTSRLVTLTGAGGVGKTRLALETARGVTDRFPDGVWYLELAALEDPDMVPGALRTVLGIPEAETGKRSVTDMLVDYYRSRTSLVLLDNCEHLVEACARLAQALLPACPGLHILATSREPLRAEGETTFLVPSLEVPEAPDSEAFPSLAKVPSVRLFVERACARSPSFMLARHNAATIAEICMRLDGIPLAIELAAARVGSLPVESINARLDQRFALLAGGLRTEIPRHRTLRALIDWSHDLLSAAERVLFRRLAVFAGGWTLESAEAVAATGELPKTDVLQMLPELAEKSLVVLDAHSGRYRMLETVRQYALERLQAAGEEAAIRTRHLDCCIALAESLVPE
ncbi:MAG TPA: BTAD domain-containing putative transcriptional regulator, partial [Anaerolineales bacterium]|nr:BTAD domain-containing putative transcriptional regulator [Anaerolineales bacterium]